MADQAPAGVQGAQNGSAGAAHPHIGEPTVGQYVAFEVAATSPFVFGAPPPYQPSKVIAAGEDAFLFAYLWVNTAPGWRNELPNRYLVYQQ